MDFAAGEDPERDSRGIAVADYDNDREQDVFIAHATDPMLYLGGGVAESYEFDNVASSKLSGADKSVAGTWGDYDRDGWLDLFVVRAVPPFTYTGIAGEQDRLFRSEEQLDDGFTDVTSTVGMATSTSETVTASWIDADEDGNLDLYTGGLGEAGTFYLSDGDGTFTDATSASSGPAIGAMTRVTGIAWADMDRDGDLDLVVSKVLEGGSSVNLVTCGNDDGRFSAENSWLTGDLSEPMLGVVAADYDLNGVIDILGAPEDDVAPPLFSGFDPGTEFFVNRSARVGLTAKATQGMVLFDYEGDGDLDFFLGRTHATSTPEDLLFLASRSTASSDLLPNWLGIRLIGDDAGNNKEGIGATIKIRVPATGTLKYETVRQVGASAGRGGQDELITRFGFGPYGFDSNENDVKVTVVWPDGYTESKTYDVDNANADLKLNAVQDFGEGDHDPGIRTGTLNMYCQPSPGEKLDWVIEWETDYNPVPSTLSVKFKKESGGGACWAPVYDAGQSYKTLTDASNKIDSTVSPLADGGSVPTVVEKEVGVVSG